MALIKCPECGKKFSEHALCCPKCGIPTEKIKEFSNLDIGESGADSSNSINGTRNKKIILLTVVLAIIIIVIALSLIVLVKNNNKKDAISTEALSENVSNNNVQDKNIISNDKEQSDLFNSEELNNDDEEIEEEIKESDITDIIEVLDYYNDYPEAFGGKLEKNLAKDLDLEYREEEVEETYQTVIGDDQIFIWSAINGDGYNITQAKYVEDFSINGLTYGMDFFDALAKLEKDGFKVDEHSDDIYVEPNGNYYITVNYNLNTGKVSHLMYTRVFKEEMEFNPKMTDNDYIIESTESENQYSVSNEILNASLSSGKIQIDDMILQCGDVYTLPEALEIIQSYGDEYSCDYDLNGMAMENEIVVIKKNGEPYSELCTKVTLTAS